MDFGLESFAVRAAHGTGLVDLAFARAGFGGDNCGSYNHSDECESDQDVMHGVFLL